MKEDIIAKGCRLDILVMERKEKHGTITDGERILLNSWTKGRQNSVLTHPSKQQRTKLPSGNSSVLNNARFTDKEKTFVTMGRPEKKGDDISRQTKWRREKESQGILL